MAISKTVKIQQTSARIRELEKENGDLKERLEEAVQKLEDQQNVSEKTVNGLLLKALRLEEDVHAHFARRKEVEATNKILRISCDDYRVREDTLASQVTASGRVANDLRLVLGRAKDDIVTLNFQVEELKAQNEKLKAQNEKLKAVPVMPNVLGQDKSKPSALLSKRFKHLEFDND